VLRRNASEGKKGNLGQVGLPNLEQDGFPLLFHTPHTVFAQAMLPSLLFATQRSLDWLSPEHVTRYVCGASVCGPAVRYEIARIDTILLQSQGGVQLRGFVRRSDPQSETNSDAASGRNSGTTCSKGVMMRFFLCALATISAEV